MNREQATAYVRGRLVPYTLCNRCKSHVLKSDLEDYAYQCVYCYEDLYEIETHQMKDPREISDFDFEDLIQTVMESDL